MITSLNQIGKQLRENNDPLDSIIKTPKLSDHDKERNNYVLKIIFDVDKSDIVISRSNLEEYSEKLSAKKYFNIITQRANHSKIYITRHVKDLQQLKISFFGKTSDDKEGQFLTYIKKEYPSLKTTQFFKALESVFNLKHHEEKLDKNYIIDHLQLDKNEILILLTSFIVNSNLDLTEPTHLSHLDGYEDFIDKKFYYPTTENNIGFCYITGKNESNVNRAKFEKSVSLTKTFVSSTKNYLSYFDDKNWNKNYQLSEDSKFNLEIASSHIFDKLPARIAGISNLVFPTFLSTSNINVNEIFPRIKVINDLAFKYREFQNVIEDIEDQISDDLFWLNFVAYQSDGNYFKIIAFIKDIPQFYFIKLLEKLVLTSLEFEDYYKPKFTFNLYSIYNLIPVRCNSKGEVLSKHNEALLIIKDIIEKRKISFDRLIDSFVELILIHRLKRFRQYKQFSWRQDSNFDYEVFNAVFNYSILFKALIDIDLLEDHNFLGDKMSDNGNQIEIYINDFFGKMNYSQPQKAMFFLGRMLDNVAYAQYENKHESKPILKKVNFNGLDKDAILRLYEDLFEKARQYNIPNRIQFNSANFIQYFNANEWNINGLSKKEALFFLLAGYSFGIALSKDRKQSLIENEENNDE